MNRTPSEWAKLDRFECGPVLRDALDDIAELAGLLPWPDSEKISFIECEIGHGRLTAKNWIDTGCPWCLIRKLQAELAATKKVTGMRLVRMVEGE